jgi:hypothetical protein
MAEPGPPNLQARRRRRPPSSSSTTTRPSARGPGDVAPLGHLVVEADSGCAALRAVLRQNFAVILMDVRMPPARRL